MPGCALRYCINHSKNTCKSKGITFHTFPRPGHGKRESWIKFVQQNRSEETWLPSDYSRICSAHFKEDDKCTTKTGRVFLKKSAVPSNNSTEFHETDSKTESLSESVSSSESIFDSPRNIELKKQLRKETISKNKLAEKLKKVQKQNFYLKKKCESYKTIFQDIKAKFGFDLRTANDLISKAEIIEMHKSFMNKNKQN